MSQLTANQLYKIYQNDGGTLNFSDWLTREKTKGIFPLNGVLNEEVQETLKKVKTKEVNKTILGFPVRTLVIAGAVIAVAVGVSIYLKKKSA
jgi:hypothetical protein